MGKQEELILHEFAGQMCDVVISTRTNGSKYVTFKCHPSYGYPSLEAHELKDLLRRVEGRS